MLKIFATLLVLACTIPAFAVEKIWKVPPGSRVCVEKMPDTMHTYIAGEIQKRKVPLVMMRSCDKADYILTGQVEMKERNWKRVLFGGKSDSGAAILYDKETEEAVWSGNAGGRSAWIGDNKSERRIAGRLVKQIKKELFKGYKAEK